jgi:hypothetical protein
MESEKLTWEDMQERYPNEWLVIVDYETDETGRFLCGVVKRHSADMDEAAMPPMVGTRTAFRYTGESTFRGLRSHANRHAL